MLDVVSRQRAALRRVRTLACLALLAWPAPSLARQSGWDQALQRFEQKLAADVERDGIGGITAGVVVGDRLVWAKGLGWSNKAQRIPAGAESIYRVGSITKSFTAVALAQLADRGKLSLDDPIERYLQEVRQFADPPADLAPITFRQMASHTAGLIREPRLPNAAAGPIEQWESKILQSIPTTSYASRPGERYSYSNIGFGVMGLAVSRAAGKPFMDLVRESILQPLGMTSSFFVIPAELKNRVTTGYSNTRDGIDEQFPAREHAGRGYKVPNGGLYSTVGDLGRFIAGMTGASATSILSAARRAEMMRVHTPGDSLDGYGLGFTISTRPDRRRFVGHGGSVAGYTAQLVFEPESRIGVVLLRNYNSGATNLGAAAAELLQALVLAQVPAQPTPRRVVPAAASSW
jgi:CubicO group peptidase (beta-lactamase class C family)